MKKEKILITGGSGFLGINLIRYLLKKNYEIISLDLVKFDYPDVKDKIESIVGDIRNKKTVAKCMKNVDIVIHCAAALPLYKKTEIYSTDIDGTKNVLDAAQKEKVKRVVHISSTAVYGLSSQPWIKESDQLVGVGPYGNAKIESENVCIKYRKKGMCIPIIRPKSFIGPERLGIFALLFDWAKSGKNFPLIGNGKNRYQLLDVEDLCDAIYLTMTLDKKKVNDVFNIGAKKFQTMKEDYQSVLDYAKFNKKIITFPALPVILALRILEFLKLSPVYKWVYETAAKDSYVSIEKAEKTLGFKPKFSNQQALLRNYVWYLEHLHDFENASGVSHRVPWKQGILTIIKKFF